MLKLFNSKKQNVNEAIAQAVKSLGQYGIGEIQQHLFIAYLQSPDSRSLYHANPRLIAEQLQLTERETLKVLVSALKEGLLH